MSAEELLELLVKRYPDKCPRIEIPLFRAGEMTGIQKIIDEIRAEINNNAGR